MKSSILKNIIYQLKIAILIVILASCSNEDSVPKIKIDSKNYDILPDQISSNVNVIFTDSTIKKAELFAKRARVYNKNQETILDSGVKVLFYSRSSGKLVSTLVSDSVVIDDKTKNMYAGGHVIVQSDSTQTTLTTSLLEWNNASQKLFSNEYVKIVSPYETLTGYGFESDQNLTNYKVFKVSGEQRNINKKIN